MDRLLSIGGDCDDAWNFPGTFGAVSGRSKFCSAGGISLYARWRRVRDLVAIWRIPDVTQTGKIAASQRNAQGHAGEHRPPPRYLSYWFVKHTSTAGIAGIAREEQHEARRAAVLGISLFREVFYVSIE
jgi:hypothetical protein